jgi:hypothetical protein
MNTTQLRRALLSDPNTKRCYGDVCPADRLPSIVHPRPRLYIVNTDKSGRPGTHWVSFYFPPRGPVEFFDPAGHAPEYYHHRFKCVVLANGPHYLYSTNRIQDFDTVTCGQYCLFYALRRCRGSSMRNIIRSFSTTDLSANEEKVSHLGSP